MELAANQKLHEEEACYPHRQGNQWGQKLDQLCAERGRVNLKATSPGLLKINVPALDEINSWGISSLRHCHNNTVVKNRHDRCPGHASFRLYTTEEKPGAIRANRKEEPTVLYPSFENLVAGDDHPDFVFSF